MGWDFIEFAGHHEMFNDFDLWTLRHFFIKEARAIEAVEPSGDATQLRTFFEAWDWIGPGVVAGADFSQYVLNRRPRWDMLLQLLRRTRDRVAAFGEFIPLDYLAAHVNSPSEYFTAAQPTTRFLTGLDRIRSLLLAHEPPGRNSE